jgi:hypothetical protein
MMTLNDVTIFQFQQLHSAIKHYEDNPYEIGMEMLRIFEGIEREVSSKMKVKEFEKRIAKYSFLNDFQVSDEWVKSFELNGKTYKVEQFIHNWNVSQFISMSNLTKDNDEIIPNIHLILAVMCEDERDIKERANEFQNDLPISIAYPIAVFFCAVLLKLENDIPNYLREGEQQIGSFRNGVGTMWLSILEDLKVEMKSIKRKYLSS